MPSSASFRYASAFCPHTTRSLTFAPPPIYRDRRRRHAGIIFHVDYASSKTNNAAAVDRRRSPSPCLEAPCRCSILTPARSCQRAFVTSPDLLRKPPAGFFRAGVIRLFQQIAPTSRYDNHSCDTSGETKRHFLRSNGFHARTPCARDSRAGGTSLSMASAPISCSRATRERR